MLILFIFGASHLYSQIVPLFDRQDYTIEYDIIDIQKGNFNNDAFIDIIIMGSGGNISVLPGKGEGTFSEKIHTAVDSESRFIHVDDFNNDGISDIIIENKLLLCDGECNFSKESALEYSGMYPPLTGDVNGDGYTDLLMVRGHLEDGHAVHELELAKGNGDGTFGEIVYNALPEAGAIILLNVNDYTSDTISDLLITYYLAYDEYGPLFKTTAPISFYSFGVMPGNGDGSFGDVIEKKWFGAYSFGDFNNDDIIDVIGGYYLEPNFHVMMGEGNGNFNSSWKSPDVDYGGPRFFILDVNGDDIADIGLFKTSGGVYEINEIMFFLGTGDGTFANPLSFEINGFNVRPSRQITVVCDFNNDSYDDFIIAPRDSSHFFVFINNGKQTSIEEIEHNVNQIISPFTLYQNLPNPFNNSTVIPYSLKYNSLVLLEIYDVSGQKVRTLVSDFMKSGTYHAVWDGRNNSNSMASSGIYLCVMKGGARGEMRVQKMVLVK